MTEGMERERLSIFHLIINSCQVAYNPKPVGSQPGNTPQEDHSKVLTSKFTYPVKAIRNKQFSKDVSYKKKTVIKFTRIVEQQGLKSAKILVMVFEGRRPEKKLTQGDND